MDEHSYNYPTVVELHPELNPSRIAERLTELTQELLDAHCDTLCLADDLPAPPSWAAHVEYLKDLQRVGRKTLADLADGRCEKRRRSPAAVRVVLGG